MQDIVDAKRRPCPRAGAANQFPGYRRYGNLTPACPPGEVFCVARDEQTVLADRARPNDCVGQLEPVFLPQLNRFLRYLCR